MENISTDIIPYMAPEVAIEALLKIADFELQDDVLPVMEALAKIFDQLEMAPTHSEYKNILNDIYLSVHTEQQLIHSLYGWMEGIDRNLLYSAQMRPLLSQVITQIQQYHGIDEVVIES